MQTKTFPVTNAAFVDLTVTSYCAKITIYENDQAGTSDYIVAAPTSADQQITRPSGSKTELHPSNGAIQFSPGQVVGAMKTVAAGPITFCQEEG